MPERLQKFISRSTNLSRRQAETAITAGRVTINRQLVQKLGTTVDPKNDEVCLDNQKVVPPHQFHYLALNKPVGYVSTRAKFKSEQSVYRLIPGSSRLKIAGRLDKNSQGLMILTNDGDLIQRLTHPSFKHEKEYEIKTARPISANQIAQLKQGVRLTEGLAKADRIKVIGSKQIRLVIHQGWKRQIRRMFEKINHNIVYLKRVRIGIYRLGNLPTGHYKEISKKEIIND